MVDEYVNTGPDNTPMLDFTSPPLSLKLVPMFSVKLFYVLAIGCGLGFFVFKVVLFKSRRRHEATVFLLQQFRHVNAGEVAILRPRHLNAERHIVL